MAQTQKQGKPTDGKPDEWQQDLNPQPLAGKNSGLEGTHPEKAALNAYEVKELHDKLPEYTHEELKQITLLPVGSRLEQGAKYLDLNDPQRHEFTAMGGMEAGSNNWYVPKTEVSYQLWNRLIGVQNPERLDQASES
ncbi:hypothetical protein H6G96_30420 [Nostoc sp. FACHB-892]|jgi:hypothetical protein|uniref:hypothetical protein n=1 Tax=Nostoc sp. FACHB-892 TaxID=2692843 RepID=UPI001684E53A|nr:hypothetical protein [Nostoc sp. FACHB-892]MBD2730514.1 hypothetical protein [Nostoc sp. FACHB-892]MBW4426996.1 hypothetical protein [Nostoc desertorum CM1-VF14]MBW4457686.1 hypothetical protein [Nostoc indistinguendum CM1-VF10]